MSVGEVARLSCTKEATSPSATPRFFSASAEVAPLARELVGDAGQAVLNAAHLAGRGRPGRVMKPCRLPHRAEQLARVVGQRADRLLTGRSRVWWNLLALPVEVVGADVEQVGQRALLVGAVRAQRDGRGRRGC